MKSFLIAFDDTDNIDTLGTGHALDRFLRASNCDYSYITRHQLFVDDLVPYTSHNSAMCAELDAEFSADELAEMAGSFLESERAEGSDPGLCVVDLRCAREVEQLIAWGLRAKTQVLQKQDAYALARRCRVHLSEHGGDGQGVVGALAAVGLRLSGNDGRVRGKAPVGVDSASAGELLALTGFEQVRASSGDAIPPSTPVSITQRQVKAVYRDFKSTILLTRDSRGFRTLGKEEVKRLWE